MSPSALALVLAAAVMHACWNALGKRGRDPLCFLWSATAVAAAAFVPLTAWPLAAEGLPRAAVPYVAATIALHAAYFYVLGRAYKSGQFSRVYPIARGLGVALVPALALVFFDERLSPLGAAGVGLVVVGIVALGAARGELPSRVGRFAHAGPGTWWAVLTGLMTAAYSVVDKAGVARLHPVPYIGLMFVGMTVLLLPAVLADAPVLRREWAANWQTILIASALTVGAYLFVLFAFRLSKTGYVVAAREVSIVLSAVIGSRWLGEGPLGPRLAGAAIVLAGVVCVAFAR